MIKTQKITGVLAAVAVLLGFSISTANAAQLQTLSMSLSESTPGANNTHTFSFVHPSNAVIKEFRFQYCKRASSAVCNQPLNLGISGANKGLTGSFLGITPAEWSITNDTIKTIRLHHVGSGDPISASTPITIPITTIDNSDIDGA